MKRSIAVALGGLILTLSPCAVNAGEPSTQIPTSEIFTAIIEQARKLATSQIPDIPTKQYSKPSVSLFFPSRRSGSPDGVVISFPIRGSHRKEKLGEMEDRVIVIIYDDTSRKPEVKKISRWLNEDSMAVKEY